MVVDPVDSYLGRVSFNPDVGLEFVPRPDESSESKNSVRVRRIVHSAHGQWYAVVPNLPVEGASEQLFIVMTLANLRSRPVRWIGWGGKNKTPVNGHSDFVVVATGLPRMLHDGEDHSEFTPILAGSYPPDDNVKSLKAWDSTGRDWKVSRWQMQKLHKEVKEALSQNLTAE